MVVVSRVSATTECLGIVRYGSRISVLCGGAVGSVNKLDGCKQWRKGSTSFIQPLRNTYLRTVLVYGNK